MALTTTTLSTALSVTDAKIKIASATGLAQGMLLLIEQEFLRVTQDYVSGTTFNVLRGRNGSTTAAHVVTSNVTYGLASDFSLPATQTNSTYPTVRARQIVSLTGPTTATVTLPPAGEDLMVILNGTSVITLTIPVPTKDMDGCELSLIPNGAAAHVLTFTGGLSGASTGYTKLTSNATAPTPVKVVACNGLWMAYSQVPIAGTVTSILTTIS